MINFNISMYSTLHAVSYVWWPRINDNIETIVGLCAECQVVQAAASVAAPLHPWSWPVHPWARLCWTSKRTNVYLADCHLMPIPSKWKLFIPPFQPHLHLSRNCDLCLRSLNYQRLLLQSMRLVLTAPECLVVLHLHI